MSRSLWLRFVVISVLFALLLSLLYAMLIREMTGDSSRALQRSIHLFIARIVESDDYAASLRHIDTYRAESQSMPLQLWVVTQSGAVLARNTSIGIPGQWQSVKLPERIHDTVTYAHSFPALPEWAIVRLNASTPTYLIISNAWLESRRMLAVESIVFVGTLVAAIFLGLSLVTLYLRARSREAKQVIAAMKTGELGARFRLSGLDTLGSLMLDFNDMANEVERLVNRLRATENTRRELLQELGHDLRTPLTSLRTSTEALLVHRKAMTREDEAEFSRVIQNELDYLERLLDDLFFIAEIAEPQYRLSATEIDVAALASAELQAAARIRGNDGNRIVCEFSVESSQMQPALLRADAHLIGRLLRNSMQNACAYAKSSVCVTCRYSADSVMIVVDDDGPGMTVETLRSFGTRRSQRVVQSTRDTFASLGLGSVIIRAVLVLHGGTLTIESIQAGDAVRGTRLAFTLPTSGSSR